MLMLKQSIKSLSLEDYSVSKRKKKKEKEKGVCVNKKNPHIQKPCNHKKKHQEFYLLQGFCCVQSTLSLE